MVPAIMKTFARFNPRLQEAIASRLNWSSLRPVQELAGAAILDGKNAVVLASTAGGKTEASIFPVLSRLCDEQPSAVGALYLAPIKALLNNQAERLGQYTEMVGMRRFVWHGDAKQHERRAFLREPAELLMTTPESLEVMLISPNVPVEKLFQVLRFVIIDEVHALAGSDRGAHLLSVLERIAKHSRHDLQRIGLSATVGNPADILRWLEGSSSREGVVVDPPKTPAKRELLVVYREELSELARDAARAAKDQKSLFFCQSRALTETLAEHLRASETEVFVHHSSVSAEERHLAEERFNRSSETRAGGSCIVCTSTLELGIDVGDLDKVFQAEAPSTVSSFLQRMGRTGRRGGPANTSFFCTSPEAVLQAVALVDLAREGWVESVPVLRRAWPILVHQLFAMALERGGLSPADAWAQLSLVPDFSGISEEEFHALLAHLIAEDYLFSSGGLLLLGSKAERTFGRRNFMELYAVFSSPALYRVQTSNGQELGSLEQNFVDGLVEGISSFLLGGRAWLADHVDHGDRIVRVSPAPRGRKPAWGGFAPQFLSFELCQRMREVVESNAAPPWLHPSAAEALRQKREAMASVLAQRPFSIQLDEGAALLWTFAGGRINHSLRYGLDALEGWSCSVDNLLLRVEGDGLSHEALVAALGRLAAPEFWAAPSTRARISQRIPDYRLSKFQPALPESAQRELIKDWLLDIEGVIRFLGASQAR